MSYLAASDYGVIGNHQSSALVNQFGAIDWCCLPYLDSPSHFAAFINEGAGGRFQICPQGEFRSRHYYIQKSIVLETFFETPTGSAILIDWMPVEENFGCHSFIFRRINVLTGSVNWVLTCNPRFDYGKEFTQGEKHPGGVLFRGTQADQVAILHSEKIPLEIVANGTTAYARFSMRAGMSTQFIWGWGRGSSYFGADSAISLNKQSFQSTVKYWEEYSHHCVASGCIFGGPWHDLVSKSSLFLKTMSAPFSGSISHSVITFQREPQAQNYVWEHRFAPLRGCSLKIQALAHLGYVKEAHAYFQWIKKMIERDGVEGLQPIYTLDGGKTFGEHPPVHSLHFQLDIYGHVLVAVSQYYKIFKEFPDELWPQLAEIADYICQAWRRPDYGPWSQDRDGHRKPEHFVVSKVFCWAALDQCIWLATVLEKEIPNRWRLEQEILHATICDQGYNSEQNTFIKSFGDNGLDASCLWLLFLNFLPPTDPRMVGTLDAIQTTLSNGVFLKRYQSSYATDEKQPDDLWSSFFFICSLALLERFDEARDRLAELCTYASPLGFFWRYYRASTRQCSFWLPQYFRSHKSD